jgi:PAS domain-containing protein
MNAHLVSSIFKYQPTPAIKRISHKALDEDRLILAVNDNGMIAECNRASGKLLGCMPSELIWQPLSKLLPKLQNVALLQGQNVNPYLSFLSRAGYLFDLQTTKGVHLACRVFFCIVGCMEQHFLRVIICPQAQADFLLTSEY